MDNVFIYQSVELPDFAREPKGTIAVFFCEWDKLQAAQNRITGKFKHSSLKVKGACTIKSFNSTDPDTGNGFKVLMVEVVKPIAARKQRGRPLGGKNKVRKTIADALPTPPHPSGHYNIQGGKITYRHNPALDAALASRTPQPITVADGDGQKQIDPMTGTEVESGAAAILDKHIADVSKDKTVKFWPMY